jgi:hypothetical protein
MYLRLAVIAALVSTFSAHAAFTFDPPAPTTHDFVKLVIDRDSWPTQCEPINRTVTRTGRTIDVRWDEGEECILIPEGIFLWRETVPLGVFEPGQYMVRLHSPRAGNFETFDLFVRSAEPEIGVFNPLASTQGGTKIVMTPIEGCAEGGWPENIQSVLIDGTSVPFVRDPNGCTIEITAPAHASGLASISVVTPQRTFTAAATLRYADPAGPPASDTFERVLVPVIYTGGGRFGSQWVTEGTLLTNLSSGYRPFHQFEQASCASGACIGEFVPWTRWGNHPHGLFVWIPRAAMPHTQLTLRARDVTRATSSWGAEIPVVREKDFRDGIDFPSVPFNGHFRLLLRLYASEFRGSLSVFAEGASATHLVLQDPCGGVRPCAEPLYAEVDLLAAFPSLAGRESATVSVLGLDFWGFISVTHNESQHVTVVSPGTSPR